MNPQASQHRFQIAIFKKDPTALAAEGTGQDSATAQRAPQTLKATKFGGLPDV